MSKNFLYGFVAMLLLPGVPSQAATLLPGDVPTTVPGAANPPDTMLMGTVLADETFPFATGGIAPVNPSPGQQPVTIAFRGTNAQVPSYLVNRYLDTGATIGPIDGSPPPAFIGTLRTVVVREAIAGTLDFYLQVANDSMRGMPGDPNDIFRISAGGFNTFGFAADALDVFFRTDGSVSDVIPGVTPATVGEPGVVQPISADRLSNNNFDPAFDFASDLGGGSSIFPDEVGRFLLIRTNATAFGPSTVTISSTGTGYVSSFAPVPEPSSAVLIVLASLGVAMFHPRPCKPAALAGD